MKPSGTFAHAVGVDASQTWRWLYGWIVMCLIVGFSATGFGFATFVRPDDPVSSAPAGMITLAWTRHGLIWRRWEAPTTMMTPFIPRVPQNLEFHNYGIVQIGHSYAANGLTYTPYAYAAVPAEVSGGVAFFAFIAAAFLVQAAFRRRSNYFAGRCPQCGYDLRATPLRCPECGLVV